MKARRKQSLGPTRTSEQAPESSYSFREKLMAILGANPLLNGSVAVAITIGFFHGWLKLKIRHPITTFPFDIFLLFPLGLVLLRLRPRESFLPPGKIGSALKLFYGVCA